MSLVRAWPFWLVMLFVKIGQVRDTYLSKYKNCARAAGVLFWLLFSHKYYIFVMKSYSVEERTESNICFLKLLQFISLIFMQFSASRKDIILRRVNHTLKKSQTLFFSRRTWEKMAMLEVPLIHFYHNKIVHTQSKIISHNNIILQQKFSERVAVYCFLYLCVSMHG